MVPNLSGQPSCTFAAAPGVTVSLSGACEHFAQAACAGDAGSVGGDTFQAAVREPGKSHGLNPIGRHAMFIGTAYLAIGQQLRQAAHQRVVVRATTTHQQHRGVLLSGRERLDNADGGQLQQGCLHVSRHKRWQVLQMLIQPGKVEQLAAGTFRALSLEIGITQ